MPQTTILDRVFELAEEDPSREFCAFLARGSEERITRGDLLRRSSAYAARFRELGVDKGDVVVLMLQHSPHQFYGFIGAMMLGAVPSFMPLPGLKQRVDLFWADHEKLFDRIRPQLIVSGGEHIEAARCHMRLDGIRTLVADDEILSVRSTPVLPSVAASSLACIQHSSGTTALKKGVTLTHQAVIAQIESYAKSIKIGENDRIASWLPLYHDMGFIACFMMSLVKGTHLVSIDPFEWVMKPLMLLDAIEAHRSTFCWMPNFAFLHLVNHARSNRTWNLESIRAFINCSEPCKPKAFERFLERFGSSGVTSHKLQVCYAMAENVFAATQTRGDTSVASAHAREGDDIFDVTLSCGVPVDGVEIEIRDANGSQMADDSIGEIYLRSAFLFDGYYKQPDMTARCMRGGWYATGDRGFIRGGELYVVGRTDDMLIVNGRNFYAHDLEAVAGEVAGVVPGRVVAFTTDDARTGASAIVMIAESRNAEGMTELSAAVRRALLERTGIALNAVSIVGPGRLIKSTSGKISRSKNRELYLAGRL